MNDETQEVVTDLISKAITEINEKDKEGLVSKIKMHVKLIMKNNEEIKKLKDSNEGLVKAITDLASAKGLSVDDFKLV